jgi:ribosomal-protein-serine acetyltransferase
MFSYRCNDDHELRLLQRADVDELFALVDSNRQYLRVWLPWVDETTTTTVIRDFIQSTLQQFADNLGFVAAICYQQKIVGIIGHNRIVWEHRIGYLGYWLAEAHQGKGLMTTSCRALVDYSFGTMNLNRLVITCATQNQKSRAIPERLGFVHEGTARDAEWLYDHFVDHEIYAKLHCDWKSKNQKNIADQP